MNNNLGKNVLSFDIIWLKFTSLISFIIKLRVIGLVFIIDFRVVAYYWLSGIKGKACFNRSAQATGCRKGSNGSWRTNKKQQIKLKKKLNKLNWLSGTLKMFRL